MQKFNLQDYLSTNAHWRVVLKPLIFEEERLSLEECRSIVPIFQVSLNYYIYPYYNQEQKISAGINYGECATNFRSKIGVWRLYQSGLFVNRFVCPEDIWDGTKGEKVIEILSTLYKITQIYQFASNLALNDVFGNDLEIRIELHNVNGRRLTFLNPERDLYGNYTSISDIIPFSKKYSKTAISGSALSNAVSCSEWIFNRFNWIKEYLRDFLTTEQESFLRGSPDRWC